METKTKSKQILKKTGKYWEEDEYGTLKKVVYKEVSIKVKYINNNFNKSMQRTFEQNEELLNEIGFTYVGYMDFLISDMDYENRVHFSLFSRLGIKKGSIDVCKRKLIESGIVKKYLGEYYMNPKYAIRGKAINPTLLDLFGE